MQEELSHYLLDDEGLLLETDVIFADVETEDLYFCFMPGYRDGTERYSRLADYLLEHVDHGEEHAVNIAYQFYKQSKAEYFVLSSFLPFLEKEAAAYRKEKTEAGECRWAEPERETEPAFGGEEAVGAEEENAEKSAKVWEREETGSFGYKAKGTGLFSWLRRKKKKQKEEVTESRDYWQDTILDSYLGQMDVAGTGETVYLADLDQLPRGADGRPVLLAEEGEGQFSLENLPVTVGKLKDRVGILLSDKSVSRVHACFEAGEDGICVRDLNSRNGTSVNGKKLQPNEAVCLRKGDFIQFGRERFRYELKH